MAVKYYIRAGFVESNARTSPQANVTGPNAPLSNGKFDLHRWLRGELTFLGIGFNDACCTNDPTAQPVRFNTTAGHLQYYNSVSNTWVTVPNL